jgi:hypothetical protein
MCQVMNNTTPSRVWNTAQIVSMVLFLAGIAGLVPSSLAQSKLTVYPVDHILKLATAAAQPATVTLLARCESAQPSASTDFSFHDLGPSFPDVKIEQKRAEFAKSDNRRFWTLQLEVTMPANSELKKWFALGQGECYDVVELTFSNKPPSSLSWVLKPPPTKLVLLENRDTSFTITTPLDRPISNLAIASSTLQQPNGTLIDKKFLELCPQGQPCSATIPSLQPGVNGITLHIKDEFHDPGIYAGSIVIAADQRSETDSFPFTVESTTRRRRLWGAFFILVGTVVAWFANIYAKNKNDRNRALIPASRVDSVLDVLRTNVNSLAEEIEVSLAETLRRIDGLREQLSPAQLASKGFIPSRWSASAGNDHNTDYQTFLSGITTEASAMQSVIAGARSLWRRTSDGQQKTQLKEKFTEKLDDVASSVKTPSEAEQGLQQITPQPVLATMLNAGQTRIAPIPSTSELQVQYERLNAWLWLIWAVVTVFLGYFVVVASNGGFGSDIDYAKAFFWGISVQLAGQNLTPASVAKPLGLSLPNMPSS